ncbi:MAG: hypothetical protein HUU55_07295 [Myxococcales bacterium]|nr:hypothetical protein [Myxococcales bacterium]
MEGWLDILREFNYPIDGGDFGELVCRIPYVGPEGLDSLRRAVESIYYAMNDRDHPNPALADGTHSAPQTPPRRALSTGDRYFLDLCLGKASLVESILAISGAALIDAPGPARAVGCYPAHRLDYAARLFRRQPPMDETAITLLAIVEKRNGALLHKLTAAFQAIRPGFGYNVPWPTAETCAVIHRLATDLEPFWEIAAADVVGAVTPTAGNDAASTRLRQDQSRTLSRLRYCCRDIAILSQLLCLSQGWLRLLLYSKLSLLEAIRRYAAYRPVEEIAEVIAWEFSPLIRLATVALFHRSPNVERLVCDTAQNSTLATRKRLQRARYRLLWNAGWRDRNQIVEPNAILHDTADDLFSYLKDIRNAYFAWRPAQ